MARLLIEVTVGLCAPLALVAAVRECCDRLLIFYERRIIVEKFFYRLIDVFLLLLRLCIWV
jgi:hypothetical protein